MKDYVLGAAGIVGEMLTLQTVSCCYSTAVVSAMRSAAGIVGRASNGTWKYGESHANTVEKCIAWNPSVTANEAGTDKGSSGAVVGFTSTQNTLSACWRNQAMSFKGSDTAHNVLADQPDCSPAEPFSKNTPGMYGSYCWPYHGKAAGTGDTVSSIALQLEWSAEAWDFTNDLPTIKAL